jgi:hypothetical protein
MIGSEYTKLNMCEEVTHLEPNGGISSLLHRCSAATLLNISNPQLFVLNEHTLIGWIHNCVTRMGPFKSPAFANGFVHAPLGNSRSTDSSSELSKTEEDVDVAPVPGRSPEIYAPAAPAANRTAAGAREDSGIEDMAQTMFAAILE